MSNGTQDNFKNLSSDLSKNETGVEYNKFGFVKDYVCPSCHSKVKLDHEDDAGTKWFKCINCGKVSWRLQSTKPKHPCLLSPTILFNIKKALDKLIAGEDKNKIMLFLICLTSYMDSRKHTLGAYLNWMV